jgi:Helix-turn-helix domain
MQSSTSTTFPDQPSSGRLRSSSEPTGSRKRQGQPVGKERAKQRIQQGRFPARKKPPPRCSRSSPLRTRAGPPFDPTQLHTIPETAQRLKCSPRHVWRLVYDEEIEVVRHKGLTRITEQAIRDFIDRNTKPRKS